jgi:glycosyltransferase involved in cell wall biosynthesis
MNPFARFLLVGDGPLRVHLEELVARLQIANFVQFRGFVSYDELPTVLAEVDILVNPSMRSETFCIVNIEAMAMEIPIVTFAVGGK